MHKVRRCYNSSRSSVNICSSSGGVQGKRGTKPDETQFGTKNDAFLGFTHLGRLMYFFTGLKKISPLFWTKLNRHPVDGALVGAGSLWPQRSPKTKW
jgi:hypothetical protein